MASFFSSSSPLDEAIDNATSEFIPNAHENLALNFDICDQIRGKLVSPRDAMRSLKRRLNHSNPNVQILTLKLIDLCIKNGGDHFLMEMASPEFTTQLATMVRNSQLVLPVRNLLLLNLQTWANAFRSRPHLDLMYSIYIQLRNEGYSFPQDPVTPIVLDTNAPPEWSDSPVCERCRAQFTFTNRKHHCRACGHTFCGDCSSKSIPLPHLGISIPVRVCDGCHDNGGKSMTQSNQGTSRSSSTPKSSAAINTTDTASVNRKEQEELDLAIALSLAEADKKQSSASVSYSSSPISHRISTTNTATSQSRTTTKSKADDNDNDPDLAAAIAASLAEVDLNKHTSSSAYTYESPHYRRKSTTSSISSAVQDNKTGTSLSTQPLNLTSPPKQSSTFDSPNNNPNQLTNDEMETIDLFAATMAKLDAMGSPHGPTALMANREYAALHQTMSNLHPRVIANLHDTLAVHKQLEDMHEKLTRAIRMYEDAVDVRLRTHPYTFSSLPAGTQSQLYASQPPVPHHIPTGIHPIPPVGFPHPNTSVHSSVPGVYAPTYSGIPVPMSGGPLPGHGPAHNSPSFHPGSHNHTPVQPTSVAVHSPSPDNNGKNVVANNNVPFNPSYTGPPTTNLTNPQPTHLPSTHLPSSSMPVPVPVPLPATETYIPSSVSSSSGIYHPPPNTSLPIPMYPVGNPGPGTYHYVYGNQVPVPMNSVPPSSAIVGSIPGSSSPNQRELTNSSPSSAPPSQPPQPEAPPLIDLS